MPSRKITFGPGDEFNPLTSLLINYIKSATNRALAATDSILVAIGILEKKADDNATAIAGKEPTITAGTTGQYWRGDKTWQTLPSGTGLPTGGTTGQVLTKNSSTNGDAGFASLPEFDFLEYANDPTKPFIVTPITGGWEMDIAIAWVQAIVTAMGVGGSAAAIIAVMQANGITVTPPAPTNGIVDDTAKTFTFTPANGYAATLHEKRWRTAGSYTSWSDCTSNVITVTAAVSSGDLEVRVKAGTLRNAGAVLASDAAFTVASSAINLVTNPNDFNQSSWTKTQVVLTPGQPSWVNGSTSTLMVTTDVYSTHGVTNSVSKATSSKNYRIKVHAQSAGLHKISFVAYSTTSGVYQSFDLDTLTTSAPGGTWGTGFSLLSSSVVTEGINNFVTVTMDFSTDAEAILSYDINDIYDIYDHYIGDYINGLCIADVSLIDVS